jgi:hypothetical protein
LASSSPLLPLAVIILGIMVLHLIIAYVMITGNHSIGWYLFARDAGRFARPDATAVD